MGLPLTKATRLGNVQFFHFGQVHITNAHGLILDVGAWTLEVACYWRLKEADETIIDFQEANLPRDTQSFSDPHFDLQLPGNTLRDRKLHELVRGQADGLNIWQATASPEGDLSFSIDGNRTLEIEPTEGVLPETNLFWRLFSNTSAESVGFGPEGVQRNATA